MKTTKTIIFSSLLVTATIFFIVCSSEKDNNINSISDTSNESIPSDNKSANKNSAAKFEPEENINDKFALNTDIEIELIDENWIIYKNETLGLSIKYPTKIITGYGNSAKTGKINIEESNNSLTLTSSITHFSYEFFIYDLENKTLESTVAEKNGKDCLIEKISKNGDIENFQIKNPAKNPLEFDHYKCTIALGKYSKKHNKLVIYRPPMECIFKTDVDRCADEEILNSIEFVKK